MRVKPNWIELLVIRVSGDHRSMVYFALDFKHKRVYHHYECGGFPPAEYRPLGEREVAGAKPK